MNGGDYWHVDRRNESSSHRAMLSSLAALRFRPIAPKPVTGGDFSGDKATVLSTSKRVKRKYVRVRKDDNNPRRKRKGKSSNEKDKSSVTEMVPVTAGKSDGGDRSPESRSRTTFDDEEEGVVESWVTVEHVTDTCMVEGVVGLGCTDVERVKNLESDTCPGFVSDGSMEKVGWVNEAYRRMVAGCHGAGNRLPEIVVRLVAGGTQNKMGSCTDGAVSFTCVVRVQYYYVKNNNNNNNNNNKDNNNNNNNNKMEKKYWKVVPCDVWRLDCGGFAWRLDVKAALSLGL